MDKSSYLLLFFVLGLGLIQSQKISKQQKQLETQRLRLKNEIKQINNLLFTNTKTRKNVLAATEDLQVKLNVHLELIKVTNQQANLLTRKIKIKEIFQFKSMN